MSRLVESRVAAGMRSLFGIRRLLHGFFSQNHSCMEGLTVNLPINESAILLPAEIESDCGSSRDSSKIGYVGGLAIENKCAAQWASVEVLYGEEVLSTEKLLLKNQDDNLVSIDIDEDFAERADLTLRIRTVIDR